MHRSRPSRPTGATVMPSNMQSKQVQSRRKPHYSLTHKLVLALVALLYVGTISVASAQKAEAITVTQRWYGFDIHLNRTETNNIALGSVGGGAASLSSAQRLASPSTRRPPSWARSWVTPAGPIIEEDA